MTKIQVAIILTTVFGFLGAISALLFGATFTRGDRKKYPMLKRLEWRKYHLRVTLVVIVVISCGASAWKDFPSAPSLETVQGPAGGVIQKATLTGFKKEVIEAAAERVKESEDYFNAAERDYGGSRYREAASNYQRSVDAIPTMSAFLNLGVSLFYTADYPKAENAFTAGIQIARKKENKEFEAPFLGNLGILYKTRGDLDRAEELYRKSLAINEELGRKESMANQYGNLGNLYGDNEGNY